MPAVSISAERLKELESHSSMLGEIAGLAEEWCCHEECSTADAVELMRCELLILRAEKRQAEIRAKYTGGPSTD